MNTDIKKGDTVKLKPKWMDEGDDTTTFVAAEDVSAEDLQYTGVYVRSTDQANMAIQPRYMIKDYMIDKIIKQPAITQREFFELPEVLKQLDIQKRNPHGSKV
jgi:hypothetical protein